MTFTVVAVWRAKPGEEEAVREVLQAMTPLSRSEPGCMHYQAHASLDDPTIFMLYEQYVDAAAYDAHKASAHFVQHVVGAVLDLLAERTVTTYETIDG